MIALQYTLNGKVNQTGEAGDVARLTVGHTWAGNTVHVWVKHGVIHECIQNLHVQNEVK